MNEKILELKKQEVKEFQEKAEKAKSIVLIDYKGIKVSEDTALRAGFRAANVEYKVVKNKIMLKAFNLMGIKDFDDALNGPTAVAISLDDMIAPAKIAVESSEKLNGRFIIKAGYAEGKAVSVDELKAIAKIPGKDVLLGQLLGLLTNPMRSLAVAISEVAKKKANG